MVSRWLKDTFHARLNPMRLDRDQCAGTRMLESRPEGNLTSHHGHLGWRRIYRTPRSAIGTLWHAPLPNARFMIVSGAFWTVNLAITEPYRFLFFSRLGLSPEAIGMLFSADLVIRSIGLLLSGTMMRSFGAKRMLVLADLVSWVVPYLILGFSTQPWHVVVAVLLTSLNAFASTPYNCMLAEGMPAERRTKSYAFLHLWNMAPTLLIPWFAGWLVSNNSFGPTLRALFLIQAASMAVGIWWRYRRLVDLSPTSTSSNQGLVRTFRQIVATRGFLAAWGATATQGVFQSISNAFLAIYLTKELRFSDNLPGWLAEVSAIGFAVGTLLIQPRLKESKVSRYSTLTLLVSAVSIGALLLHPTREWLLAIWVLGGLCSAVHAPATSSLLTSALPETARDHGFALSYVGVHLVGALCMPLAGMILDRRLDLFPVLVAGFLLAWAFGIWLTRSMRPSAAVSTWEPEDASQA